MASPAYKQRGKLLYDRLDQELSKYGYKDLAEYMVQVMMGSDPRPGVGKLFAQVSDVKGDLPTLDEWNAIKMEVLMNNLYAGEPVSLDLSVKTAAQLFGHVYPALARVDAQVLVADVTPKTMSEADLRRFAETWKAAFTEKKTKRLKE